MSSALTQPASLSPAPVPQPPVAPVAEPKQRKPWKWLIIGAVIVLAGVAYLIRSRPRQAAQTAVVAQVRTVRVTSGPLDVTSRISGQTAAKNYANVTAPRLAGPEGNRAMLLEKLAPSGSLVKKGDVIAEIDGTTAKEHIDEVKETVALASLDVNKRQAEQALDWETLQQTLRVAKSELDKARLDASASEVRTTVDQELIKLAVEEAEAQYKQLQADLASQRAVHNAELAILEITSKRHARHLGKHAEDLKKFTMRAPMDGLVVMQQVFRGAEMAQIQDGDSVFPGQAIMKVVNTQTMQLEAQVNQAESSHFRIGQRTRIRLDAFPGMELDGKIASIGALAASGWRNSFYIRNVPVRVQIIGSDPRLIPDLSASAEVFLEHIPLTLIAPRAVVKHEGDRAVVYVKKGETFERRPIELGPGNFTHVAIASGVKAGEELRID